MDIPFWKMHGAGNDFILIDAVKAPLSPTRKDIAAWCQRHKGIGADGLILLLPPQSGGDFRMQFFNPDGGEADMCGNGARCAARLAYDLKLATESMTIETAAGHVQATMLADARVRLQLPQPKACQLIASLTLDSGASIAYSFADTGVPHAIIECESLDDLDIRSVGRAIRTHAAFAPAGTNVDFITVTGPDSLRIRTYERGVEDETLACGTGIAAAAVTAVRSGRVHAPVTIETAGGDLLHVDVPDNKNAPLLLSGPAVHVFKSTICDANKGAESS